MRASTKTAEGGSLALPRRAGGASPIQAKLDALPPTAGCYLFFDKSKAVVYVGKAKNLRSRVRSYFQDGGTDARYFIPILRRTVRDVETVLTASEKEAAILEAQLVKQHQPRYNVKLRDDKDFLSLRVDQTQKWPRLETVRRPSADGARYFGPYHSATSARRTLHLVNKHFQLRTCSDAELASRKRPCLQYQIKRCPAPCVMAVDPAWYAEQVRSVGLFLDGRHDELTKELSDRMRDASRAMEFELAAIYRDQLKAVEAAHEGQRIVAVRDVDQDAIGLYREGSVVEIEVVESRHGRVQETYSFSMRGVEVPDEEVLGGFLGQHYGDMEDPTRLPDEILLPLLPDGAAGVAEWLGERRGRKVEILLPQRGPRADLLDLARENAAHAFREKQRSSDDLTARLEELRERLRLPSVPHRIECCDISHLGGGDAVGAIVSMVDGQLDKKRYKSFRVRSTTGTDPAAAGGDDYAAMYEVLARRFRRGKLAAAGVAPPPPEDAAPPSEAVRSGDDQWELPDLFVVDGGRGQLNVALSAAQDLGLHDLSVVGLAKERENAMGETLVDRVYLPGQKNGIPLRSQSSALFFLARVRDEAHRFANHVRRRVGKARRLRSDLEDVPGIGPAGRKALLSTLGSLAAVRAATDAQILAVPGITRRHLVALRKVFAGPS